jgi:hypothetical protein
MALFPWRRWWSERGLNELRLLAIEYWDPVNVYDDPTHADAYDAYLERVGRMLKRGKGSAEIARYLGAVRTKAFAKGENEEADEQFADRVVAWYSIEKPA